VKQAHFRFYAELNDLLAPDRRGKTFLYSFEGRQSVKHLIEALGVPHTEVDLVLINGESAGFEAMVEDGDRVSVYPVFESFDIAPLSRVRPQPLRRLRFVADSHLGRLAAYMRMLGFDTLYRNDYDDEELSEVSSREHRIVLTRDRDLLKRKAVTHGYFVRETGLRRQLAEVLGRFDLRGSLAPFTRCMRCNGVLEDVAREAVEDRVPPRSRRHADRFCRCGGCGQVYWNGSHYRRMQKFIAQVIGGPGHGIL
jgi:uncharacterized protein with PIN domain